MNLHVKTVSPTVLSILEALMSDEKIKNFILVGGTALALQIGHRMSVDIDLFSEKQFDKNEILAWLKHKHGFRLPVQTDIGLAGFIGNTKVDIVYYQNGFVKKPIVADNIRMVGLEEIAAMKLEAISNSANRMKDYVDVAFLSEHLSLNDMLRAFKEKFDEQATYALRSLAIFSEIDKGREVFLINGVFNWEVINRRIIDIISSPSKVFPPMQF